MTTDSDAIIGSRMAPVNVDSIATASVRGDGTSCTSPSNRHTKLATISSTKVFCNVPVLSILTRPGQWRARAKGN